MSLTHARGPAAWPAGSDACAEPSRAFGSAGFSVSLGCGRTGRARLWLALAPAMLTPLADALVYFVALSDGPAARAAYAAGKAFMLLWPVLALALILPAGSLHALPGPARHLRSVAAGAAFGLAVAAVMFAALASPLGPILAHASSGIRPKLELLGVLDHYWLFAAFLSLAHSMLEEYYWRWFVFGRLRRAMPGPAAHALAAVAFAAHHAVILSCLFSPAWAAALTPCVAAGGAAWSLLYERHRSILGPWISHMLIDIAAMAAGYLMAFGYLAPT